jgi:hypothetical protein
VALTSHSDFYVAIHDAGINRLVGHVMRKRPSLFNYGSSLLASNPQLLCQSVDVAPEVLQAGNPLVTVLDPLPIIGTSLALNYAVQLTKGEIDFYPGNVFALPAELNPPLGKQRLGVHFQVCAGMGCPPSVSFPFPGRLPGKVASSAASLARSRVTDVSVSKNGGVFNPSGGVFNPDGGVTVLPTRELDCFCLDLFATGGAKITGAVGNQLISPFVDGIDIVDLKPDALKNMIECYALLALNQGILPGIGQVVSKMAFTLFPLPSNLGSILLSASTAVPNNPAIEDDQLKAFINLDSIVLNINIPPTICQSSGGGGGGGGGGGTVTRTTRGRTRTGVFDLTAAVSAKTFGKIFGALVKGFHFACADHGNYGPFSASYDVEAHLEGGSIQLRNNGTIEVSDLEVKWDDLSLNLCVDIPEQCVGGGCVIPNPFDGCILSVPKICIFSDNPDFCIPINLGGFITSEVTFTAGIRVFYGIGSGVTNRWQIVIVPELPFDLQIIDVADTVGTIFKNLIDAAINGLLGGIPDWAKALLNAFFDSVDDIIRFVLDIPDDIAGWLMDVLTSLGVFDVLLAGVYDFLAKKLPAFEIDDPVKALDQSGPLIPVMIPIEFLGVQINSDEMIIEGDVGN